jgi:hypothetical protein
MSLRGSAAKSKQSVTVWKDSNIHVFVRYAALRTFSAVRKINAPAIEFPSNPAF